MSGSARKDETDPPPKVSTGTVNQDGCKSRFRFSFLHHVPSRCTVCMKTPRRAGGVVCPVSSARSYRSIKVLLNLASRCLTCFNPDYLKSSEPGGL